MCRNMKPFLLLLTVLGGKLVRAAIDIDGVKVIEPVTEEDPSPIADINTYHPDQHDCPLSCTDYTNVHSWITYFSVERLRRCSKPMLLQIPVSLPLGDTVTTLIRGCTLSADSAPASEVSGARLVIDNPKKENVLSSARMSSEASCVSAGVEVVEKVQLFTSRNEIGERGSHRSPMLFKGIQQFFDMQDNCDEQFVFAYYNETVAGVYIGSHLGKGTVNSTLRALSDQYVNGTTPSRIVAEACHTDGTDQTHTFGIIVENTRNLESIRKTALEWSKGNCVSKEGLVPSGNLPGAVVLQISVDQNSTLSSNVTHSHAARHVRSMFKSKHSSRLHLSHRGDQGHVQKRATCGYITVADGDTCNSLVRKCGITAPNFVKFNPKSGLCSALKAGDFVCCTAGDQPSAEVVSPKPDGDGVCATHLIQNGDTCSSLATRYGITVDDIEKWNKGRTWAWTECKDMLFGYNLCVSGGFAPMPPPQAGTECGPLVPGTAPLTDRSMSLADLNPCPLKACCSNWGFCGVFPSHCEKHAPEGGGPGTKAKGYQYTCVSNCGNEIKSNSDPPAKYERIGYYESWNMNRDCLWLKAENANTDGTYTHIHWGFAEIDPSTFKVIIKDNHKQWAAFKALKNVKRIVSFGGWAYSTENPGALILRQAIIANRNIFADNLAQFAQDEGIDGIDIDWEYPGAPDILVDGLVIGKQTDGVDYLKFLIVLKQKLGTKLVSIAAPASFWYLKAFPIDRIAKVIDYIVYMTYDLHGQWDYGNPNSFDSCDSGRCIRSHVNLTETNNALSMITKAGVPNNKIFVGESSYGRSFRMAQDGCWSAMCEFTGSRSASDAAPGRCTNTSGYLAQAEINEMIQHKGVRKLFDPSSSTDVIIYNGDYISYLDEESKASRRVRWKNFNFAGTIDWAVDLQSFSDEDRNHIPDRSKSGKGCVSGEDNTLNTHDLCEFSCRYGFCPETVCTCTEQGDLHELPEVKFNGEIEAWVPSDVDINRLCKFTCKYGHCPDNVCVPPVIDEEIDQNNTPVSSGAPTKRSIYEGSCTIWKGISEFDISTEDCKKFCKPRIDAAQAAGKTTNYGCIGTRNGSSTIPWNRVPKGWVAPGTCLCDNVLMNEIADTVLEAMPMIAQISCYILMSSLKVVLDIGAQFVPGVGKILDAALDMAATAAQIAAYLYPEEEDPEGAFSWWLAPCGGTNLVPEEIKKLFGILSAVPSGITSFVEPKRLRRGSGRRNDDGNPNERDRSNPSAPQKPQSTQKKCKPPPSKVVGPAQNVWQQGQCKNGQTHLTQWVITSLSHIKNPGTVTVKGHCKKKWSQACYHYSSAISVSPAWSTMECHTNAASTAWRLEGKMTKVWSDTHNGDGWLHKKHRVQQDCDRDEYPPAYFIKDQNDPILINGGVAPGGQLMRWLPDNENRGGAAMWRGACFRPSIQADKFEDDKAFEKEMKKDQAKRSVTETITPKNKGVTKTVTRILFSATVNNIPEFTITAFDPVPPTGSDDGLRVNECWPSDIAKLDPGFVLLEVDPWYKGKTPPYDYKKPYNPPSNGS
ncbi:glycoside hydrolase family 18 protein [Phaeosphaeriaceae sp. PMI808]|nr:glycoside hydrolase family 18 protein [Phaeosphaeriaceae sp. PMI808]